MATFFDTADPTRRILGPDGRPWSADAPDGIKLPHPWTFAALVNQVSKSYSYRWDEAYKQSRENALTMRRDCFLMSLLRERQLPTEQMRGHIEPEDKKDARQVEECAYLERVIGRIPHFQNYKRSLLEAQWFGRAGAQQALTWDEVDGKKAVCVSKHLPVNGDKIQFDWDGCPKIRLYTPAATSIEEAGGNIQWTDVGAVLKLDKPFWRARFCIHKHDVVDADFLDDESAGQVGGVGIRAWVYWMDWLKKEVMTWMLDYMERTGLGLTIYYYDAANKDGKAEAMKDAKNDSRNTKIVWPRSAEGKDMGPGIERIETSTSGTDVILGMMKYFDDKIERFIIGQTMSSRQEGGGLGGSHAAEFQANTKYRIIKSDCDNLAETLTEDLILPLQRLNPFTAKSPHKYKWVFNVDEYNPEGKLKAVQTAYSIGVSFDADEVREVTGFSKPNDDSEIIEQADPMEMLEATAAAKAKASPGANGKAPSNGKPSANGNGKKEKAQRYQRAEIWNNPHQNGHGRLNLEFYEDLRLEKKSFLQKVIETVKVGEKRIETAVKKFFGRVWARVKKTVDRAFGLMAPATPPGADPGTKQPPGETTTPKPTSPPATEDDIRVLAETVAEEIAPEELKEDLKPALERIHTAGSLLELDDNVRTRVGAYSGREAWTTKFSTMRKKLPEPLKAEATAFLEETFKQPWWDNLPGEVGQQLAKTLAKGLKEGETIEGLIARLQNTFADLSETRARLIARTETTGALNAGLQAARIEQYRRGLVKAKTWQDMDDEDVRETHDEANGQTVGVLDDFTVGGELCQYPGNNRLSAKERCRCRCIARSVPADSPIDVQNYSRDEGDGHWVTIEGTHVHIKNGKIDKGPADLVGKSPLALPGRGSKADSKHDDKVASAKADTEAARKALADKIAAGPDLSKANAIKGHLDKLDARIAELKAANSKTSPATHTHKPTGHPAIDAAASKQGSASEKARGIYDNAKQYADLQSADQINDAVGLGEKHMRAALEGHSPAEIKESLVATGLKGFKGGKEAAIAALLDRLKYRIGSNLKMNDIDLTRGEGKGKSIAPDAMKRLKEAGYKEPSQHSQRQDQPDFFAKSGEPHWVTMHGQHVLIGEDGRIEKGPAHLVGKSREEIGGGHADSGQQEQSDDETSKQLGPLAFINYNDEKQDEHPLNKSVDDAESALANDDLDNTDKTSSATGSLARAVIDASMARNNEALKHLPQAKGADLRSWLEKKKKKLDRLADDLVNKVDANEKANQAIRDHEGNEPSQDAPEVEHSRQEPDRLESKSEPSPDDFWNDADYDSAMKAWEQEDAKLDAQHESAVDEWENERIQAQELAQKSQDKLYRQWERDGNKLQRLAGQAESRAQHACERFQDFARAVNYDFSEKIMDYLLPEDL